jgi:hypothetical protein
MVLLGTSSQMQAVGRAQEGLGGARLVACTADNGCLDVSLALGSLLSWGGAVAACCCEVLPPLCPSGGPQVGANFCRWRMTLMGGRCRMLVRCMAWNGMFFYRNQDVCQWETPIALARTCYVRTWACIVLATGGRRGHMPAWSSSEVEAYDWSCCM